MPALPYWRLCCEPRTSSQTPSGPLCCVEVSVQADHHGAVELPQVVLDVVTVSLPLLLRLCRGVGRVVGQVEEQGLSLPPDWSTPGPQKCPLLAGHKD